MFGEPGALETKRNTNVHFIEHMFNRIIHKHFNMHLNKHMFNI